MNKIQLIIDRFEGDFAVCEREKPSPDKSCAHVNIPRAMIDARAVEGSVIFYCETGKLFMLDSEATECRTKYIRDLAKDIWG